MGVRVDGIDVAVGTVAARQHGVFTRAQAVAAGATDGQVRVRRRSGRWVTLRNGVYAIRGTPATYERRVMAAVLSAGAGAVASHLTAAALHRFPDVVADTIEISAPPGSNPRLPGVARHRPSRLVGRDISIVSGIPVTSYARTLVDCTGRLSLGQVARALDAGLVARRVSLRAIEMALEGLGAGPNRRPAVIRTLLGERGAETAAAESRPEMRVFRLLVAAGLPAPVQQHPVDVGSRYRLDLAYPAERVAIEYDGWDHHRTRIAFDRDRRRDRLLQVARWTVLRFTSASTDEEIVATVAAFVAKLHS